MDYYTGRIIIQESEYDDLLEEKERLEERVQELVKENAHHEKLMRKYHLQAVRNGDIADRRKQALEFYADRVNHEPTLIHEAEYENGILVSPPDMEPSVIYFDKGEKARKALKGES